MNWSLLSMKSIHNNVPTQPKRRLKTKPVLIVLGLLLLGNLLWFIAWLIPNDRQAKASEEVASVDGKIITKEQWMASMETIYGKEVLLDMVNAEVMEAAAKKNDIKVTDAEIDLELALIRSTREGTDTSLQAYDDEILRKKIRSRIILEKVLAKDINVKKKDIKDFYENNKNLYNIPTSYRTSVIYVATEEEGKAVLKELEDDSSFEGLARERSTDPSSASLGGDVGYISKGTDSIDEALVEALEKVKEGKTSGVIALKDGQYAVALVKNIFKGQAFSYEEVEGHIKRELALSQIPQSVTQESFWQEYEAEWIYGEQ